MAYFRVDFFRVSFVGWTVPVRPFVGEAYFWVVAFRVALCLDGIFSGGFFPGSFCRVAYFLDPALPLYMQKIVLQTIVLNSKY